MSGKKQISAICLFLTIVPLIAFWQLNHSDFVTFDDPYYVTENIHIQKDITVGAIRWAFTTMYQANWHPLTWVSHLLDVQLFGLNPRGHHLTNLLFHIANTLLLFFVLHRMTKSPWKSAFVAALFALHPLHVESVAWVAERKDVLSTFFWMLTMGAYVYYVEHRTEVGEKWTGILRYSAVLVFLALGLMAKPMLVTLPFVLLLLDYWPLQRFEQKNEDLQVRLEANRPEPANKRRRKSKSKPALASIVDEAKPVERKYRWATIRPLLWEKIPLFALTALSCIVTFIAQKEGGAVRTLEALPPSVRISNTFVSYIIYIGKMIWPKDLAVYYPHPGSWPLWQILGAVLLLMAATSLVIWKVKMLPYLVVGWVWFMGTLVPVIGIVQVGGQALADRYTYVPLIGLFIMIAWGMPELLKEWRYRKVALAASSALILSGLFILTWTQVGYWHDSIALYDHTLQVTDHNDMIHTNRGVAYAKLGDHRQAIADFDSAIAINPGDVQAYDNRGGIYGKLGNREQAMGDLNKAIEIDPGYAQAYNHRGAVYGDIGNEGRAIEEFNKAIEINPEYAEAYYNMGVTYSNLGNHGQAIEAYNRALEINPGYVEVYYNRSVAYSRLGNRNQAIEDLKRAASFDDELAKKTLRSLGLGR